MVATLDNDIEKIELINMTTQIGSFSTTLLVDSRSACSILDTSLATRVAKSSPEATWVSEMDKPQLSTLSNPIEAKSNIRTQVTSNGWHITDAGFKDVDDGLKPLMTTIFLISLDLQSHDSNLKKGNQVNIISTDCAFKEHVAI